MEGESAQSKIKPSQKSTLQTLLLNNQSENTIQKQQKEENNHKNNTHILMDNNIKTEEKPIDAVYCVGEIENLPANIIIDSGSVSNTI